MAGLQNYKFHILTLFFLLVFLHPAVSDDSAGFVYTDPPSMSYMKNWLICGSFSIEEATPDAKLVRIENNHGVKAYDNAIYRTAFEFDYLMERGGERQIQPKLGATHTFSDETYTWTKYANDFNTDSIDLRRLSNPFEDVIVYAYAEIQSSKDKKIYGAFGSDDGIKVWLNGDLILNQFTGRSLQLDEDVVEMNLKKGANRLLLKIQNMTLDYGFSCRFISLEDYKTFQFKKRNRNSLEYFVNLFGEFFDN